MTISDATHALAAPRRREAPVVARQAGGYVRLADAIARVEPTWVEAVAVVQAVCAQLPAGHAVPALDTLLIGPEGQVTFPPTDAADDVSAVSGAGRLLSAILRTGDCPMPVWEATEAARRSPARLGSARAFGASLTCFPVAQGPIELARYHDAARRAAVPSARPATASFAMVSLPARAGMVLLAVLMAGIGAGVSVGAFVAGRTSPAPPPSMVQLQLRGR